MLLRFQRQIENLLKKLRLGPGFGSITPLYLVQIKNNQTLNKKG